MISWKLIHKEIIVVIAQKYNDINNIWFIWIYLVYEGKVAIC